MGMAKRLSELEKDLDKDAQLRHAVSLLSGWDIIAETIKPFINKWINPLT